MRRAGIIAGALAACFLGAAAQAVDSDGDGVDDTLDNCRDHPNPNQVDDDGDGCGNRCDADYDQTGTVGGNDWNLSRAARIVGTGHNVYDHNSDGVICSPDFIIFLHLYIRKIPGPSIVAGRDPVACP